MRWSASSTRSRPRRPKSHRRHRVADIAFLGAGIGSFLCFYLLIEFLRKV
jgi:hypothetical protein